MVALNEPLRAELQKIISWAVENDIEEEILPRNVLQLFETEVIELEGYNLSDLPENFGILINLGILVIS